MAENNQDYVSVLNDLIETAKDGEKGFHAAAEAVEDLELRSKFEQYSAQRVEFVRELRLEVQRLGGEAAESGTVSGALHRGWLEVKGAVTGHSVHQVLEECERGEDAAVQNYQDALGKDLPGSIRTLIEHQYQEIQQAHNHIRNLRDASERRENRPNLQPAR